jgi:alkaline phosphatase D
MTLSRRQLLTATAAASASLAVPALPASATAIPAAVRRDRPLLPSGIASGDVTPSSAVLWSRTDRPARLVVDLTSHGRFDRAVRLRGPITGPDADFTAQLPLRGLRPGQRYDYRIGFEDSQGHLGETAEGTFSTPGRRGPVTFVFTGDTAGQGWGINPDRGGMAAYETMRRTTPDFFLHSGDNIYADGVIKPEVLLPDGTTWKNVVTEEVSKVAEMLTEYRGRYKYNLLDHNVRAFNADVPIVGQWDDHETLNNWYPGEILTDARYTEKRVDVLASRARQAFYEYLPMSHSEGQDRIYRKVSYGPLLDVFCLDMRTYRGANPKPDSAPTPILGQEQADWLVREVARSKATWKVIASDMPLGLLVPDGAEIEAVANGRGGAPSGRENEIACLLSQFKRRRVRNAVWVTADVHYCAAHHYDPSRAAYTDFDPFWELVAGPIHAGTAPAPNLLDPTFGPRVEFARTADYVGQPPNEGRQFFGHVEIDPDSEVFTASLRDLFGTVLWRKDLDPA